MDHPSDKPGPASDEVFTASLAEERAASSPPGRWTSRLIILAMLAVVLGPVLWKWVPREIARWHTAVAAEKHDAGNVEEAVGHLDQALRWDPESVEVYQQRGAWHLESGRYQEAVDDYTRVIDSDPTRREAYMQRSVALQHLGRRAEAIEDWSRLEELAEGSLLLQAIAWNGRAYARALANAELDLALEEVQRALDHVGPNAAMLDTRGFIHYLRGDLESARQDLDQAVTMMEADWTELVKTRSYTDRQQYERQRKEMEQSVAVLRYHRGLVLEKQGAGEEARRDYDRVRELGFEPGENLF